MKLPKNVFQKAAITVFMLALLAPGLAVGMSGQVRETVSGLAVNPASWPELSNRLRVATPLWNDAVSGYSTLLYRLGTSSNEGFGVMGRDGWMFLGNIQNANFAQALGRRQLSDAELTTWATQLGEESAWLHTRGIPMLFVVGPAKWSVYGDKLPAWTDGTLKERPFDQLLRTHPELPLVDVRQPLIDARATADTYSRLNSHWTQYGATIGWQALVPTIDKALGGRVQLPVPKIASVQTIDAANEYQAMMGINVKNPWTVPDLAQPLPAYSIVQADGTLAETDGSQQTGLLDLPKTTKNSAAGNNLTALVLRDSMGDSLSPYLQSSFGTLVQVRHNIDASRDTPNVEALVDLVKPDIVIYEMAERHFNSALVDSVAWTDANRYDRADTTGEQGWQEADRGVTGVSLAGPVDLSSPVTLSWDSTADRTKVLRLSLLADSPGDLVVTTADGQSQSLRVAKDSNVLFTTLDPQAGGTVTLTKAPGSGGMHLTSATVRSELP